MQTKNKLTGTNKPNCVFYLTLRTGTPEQIQEMFSGLQREGRQLLDSIISLIYFMRGAVSYTEAMNMSFAERDILAHFLSNRLEIEKKSSNPIY